jgi:hypothetical protein
MINSILHFEVIFKFNCHSAYGEAYVSLKSVHCLSKTRLIDSLLDKMPN